MGIFFYGSGRLPVPVEDRLLSHLKLVITSKLRRSEGLLVSWTEGTSNGRSSVWVHAGTDLHYKFDGSKPPLVDRRLLEELNLHSMDARGIDLSDPRYSIKHSPDDPG